MNTNQIIKITSPEGASVLILPLSNSQLTVKIFEADYKELQNLGAGLPWKLVQGQIVVRNNRKNLNVSRLILDAGEGTKVWFADGDTLNLCRTNLVLTAGNGVHRTRDALEDATYSNFRKKRVHGEYVVISQ
jgi:hypothetical protein